MESFSRLHKLLLCMTVFAASNILDVSGLGDDTNGNPVKVNLYFETLCGDTIRFIKEQLWPTHQALKGSGVVDVTFYPYGNAKQVLRHGMWHFTCQHHEKECQLNLVEVCVNHFYFDKMMSFVYCAAIHHTFSGARWCAARLGMDWNRITECTGSVLGNRLKHFKRLVCSEYGGVKPKGCLE